MSDPDAVGRGGLRHGRKVFERSSSASPDPRDPGGAWLEPTGSR